MALPSPRDNQNYVTISPFAAGHITLPEYIFYAPSDPTAKVLVPSLSFLIQHPQASLFGQGEAKQFHMLFDLGVRGEPTRYVPKLQKHIESRSPIKHRPSALDTLSSAGLTADDIDAIAISHVHWDHHGDPEDFPNSTFLLGPGAKGVLSHGLPGTGNHSVFDPDLYKNSKLVEFEPLPGPAKDCVKSSTCSTSNGSHHATKGTTAPSERDCMAHTNGCGSPCTSDIENANFITQQSSWKPLGPFPNAIDLLSDGSIYVISAPGHLPGHINLLCRTSPTTWVYLGGDTFHDRDMLTGRKWITTYPDESGSGRTCCIHVDKEEAQKSLERVGELVERAKGERYEVECVVAHDVVWYKENQGRLLPNML